MNERERSLLVFNAKFVSRTHEEEIGAKRLRRFYLQAIARELLPKNRVIKCLRSMVPGNKFVEVRYSEKHKRAHYGNLVQCANVWVCPVCASKITERRRVELEDAIGRAPWPAVMITLTLQHTRKDRLEDLRRDFCEGRRVLRMGHWWLGFKERWGILGTITATETTYSLQNGWHLHTHELYFVKAVPDTDELRRELSIRFEAVMRGLGRYVSPLIGVHVRTTTHAAGDYISKWGAAFEMAKPGAKTGKENGHYNPFDLLYLYAGEGKNWAGEAFKEYAAAMKGVNQIRWSPKLRERLGIGKAVTDKELVEAPGEADRLLALIHFRQWQMILNHEKVGQLLEVASTGDAELLRAWLLAIGVTLES